jgi:hypothetical protein
MNDADRESAIREGYPHLGTYTEKEEEFDDGAVLLRLLDTERARVADLAMFVQRLSRQLRTINPNSEIASETLEWLDRNGLGSNVLRAAASAPPTSATCSPSP